MCLPVGWQDSIDRKWPINVRTLSELLRGRECVVQQWSKSGAGRIERFEGRRWCGRGRMLAMGFPSLWAGPRQGVQGREVYGTL